MSTDTLVVRLARPEEANDVAALAADTFPLACPPFLSDDDVQAFINTELSPQVFAEWIARGAVLVAEHHNSPDAPIAAGMAVTPPETTELLGYTTVLDEAHPDYPGSCYLTKCYVRAEAQGTGVAHRMIEETCSHFSSATGMWLGTSEENQRAQRFYMRNGFEYIGTRTFNVGEQTCQDVVLYRSFSV